MKNLLLLIVLLFSVVQHAQHKTYQAEEEKINNLIHTKLKVDFNFEKSQLNGEAWITLAPHFYPTNKVVLDAKADEFINIFSESFTEEKNRAVTILQEIDPANKTKYEKIQASN